MTATEALERRIDELCSENERLRQENAKLCGFWTHDGTWHVELPRLPDGIAVTTPDSHDREVRTAMVWRYVREDEAENAKLRELVKDNDNKIEALRNENMALQRSLLPPMSIGQDILDDGGFWRFVTKDDGTLRLLWDDSISEVLKEHGWVHKDEYNGLHELVRDMRTCIDHACMCEFCPLFVTEEDMGERRCIADMKAHMRELGIEVDG